ncbi:cytochrome P450 [Infundibulicybe gibba]|nr:cytochrome P450 [Infundibulicybe gibba]
MHTSSVFAGLTSLLVALFASIASLPPGPKPVPVLGNVKDLTAKELWLPATKWSKEHGDVCYLHVLGQGLVFLSSPEAALDLLDKRGSIYSDKPHLVMAGELCVAFTSYGEQSRRQRKLMHQAFGVQNIPSYHPLMETETHAFLRRLVADPENYNRHTRRYAGGLTLSVVYGYEVISNNDKFLTLAEECVDLLANRIASGGGIWPVDIFPSLRYLPTWFPGAGFKRNAMIWKAKMEEFVDKPYQYIKESMKTGSYKPSFCSTLLDDGPKVTQEFDFDLKWTANSMYSASMDTTITTVSHFLLAMMEYPEVLEKAQKEIDSVVGTDRLPTFSDRASLPYVDAILSETWRWGVPVPLNLPHRLIEDDVYRGMHIPKGSLVFGNIWAMLHDERMYPNASQFKPERFMEKVDAEAARLRDPRNYVFGFGRRLCPGSNLVESSVWLLIVSMIATLDISQPVDDHGNIIKPKVVFNNPIFRIPDPFKCNLRPRSEQSMKLILQSDGVL